MKTIAELNSKPWYRLLKVVFILAFIATLGITTFIAFSNIGSYQTDYTITCNYGNRDTFLAAKDKEIYISSFYDYTDSLADLPNYQKQEISTACGITDQDIDAIVTNITNGTDNGKKLFDVTETKINVQTYTTAVLWSLLGIVIIWVVAEIFKRTFYYIVLGSLRPKRKLGNS